MEKEYIVYNIWYPKLKHAAKQPSYQRTLVPVKPSLVHNAL